MKSIAIVLNPTSGGGAGRKRARDIVEWLAARDLHATVQQTTGHGHARVLARELARLYDTVVAAGGDGTIHETANGLLDAQVGDRCTLALIPVGTGNDFVKIVPGTRTMENALRTIVTGLPKLYDVGVARWQNTSEYFVNGMGTGIDTEVVRQLSRVPHLPGPAKYLLALVRALAKFRPIRARVTVDGQPVEREMMIVSIGNGVCQGGGFYLSPQATPHDGRLNITLVEKLGLPGIIRVVPKVLRGTQEGDRAVDMRLASAITLESLDQRPLFFQLDGELREPAALMRLDIEVLPNRLPVLTGTEDS